MKARATALGQCDREPGGNVSALKSRKPVPLPLGSAITT